MSYSSVLLFCVLFHSLVQVETNSSDCISKNQLDSFLSYEATSLSNDISVVLSVKSKQIKDNHFQFVNKLNDLLLPEFKFEIFCLIKPEEDQEDEIKEEENDFNSLYKKNIFSISLISKHNIIQKEFFEKRLEFSLYDYLTSKYNELKNNSSLSGKSIIYLTYLDYIISLGYSNYSKDEQSASNFKQEAKISKGISSINTQNKPEISSFMTETNSKIVNFTSKLDGLILLQAKTNKGLRFLFSLLLLILSSILCFLIVKNTVDWATYAKTELNRYNDIRAKALVDKINEKFNFIRRSE